MITAAQLIAKHAADIAFVAEQDPATTLEDFNEQLDTAAERLGPTWADINGAEELPFAVTYLADAIQSTDDAERAVLVNRAASYLTDVSDVVQEYREMAA
ncbi:hypothetical protein G3M53_91450 [Streptomyces sp. SID7982]|uniref:hypothetical protein n=1 Tax=Streptomyces sp. SID5614 TaxID=2690306 RepID=UPI00136B6A15|nr:hypothetical protein [Streptomyces sp. SID5614]MZG04160.1 hypothetical protein [Streptomyces sp. SID5614]NEE41573.1 hypothetical protein [Streptomyces sp. SID7982]